MATLKDVIFYLISKYPKLANSDLSNARVTKMVYLSDWHHAVNYSKQITNIHWFFDNYGPFVHDVKQEVESHQNIFSVKKATNYFGREKTLFEINDSAYQPSLTDDEKQSMDHVINTTQTLGWDSFIKLVYSTYPIMTSERYTPLDLISKAHSYIHP